MMVRTILLVLVLISFPSWGDGENWPQWRGPSGNGVSRATRLPTTWTDTENIRWRVDLPSWSGSTPIVWGDRIFATSPASVTEETEQPTTGVSRTRRGGRHPGGQELLLLCFARADGTELWRRRLDDVNRIYRKHNNTSPSPVTDGRHVWAITGTGSVCAFDMSGEPVWRRRLQNDYGDFGANWGYASSPLFYGGSLIVQVLHGTHTDEPSYLVAFDAATGAELWLEERPTDALAESSDAYTTPALSLYGAGRIVVSGGDYVSGHDPHSGREIWRAAGLNPERRKNFRVVASPLVVDGVIYAPTRKKPLLALHWGGSGDVTDTHLAWKWEGPASTDVPTPVCDGRYFYMVDDGGMVVCLDAKTGTLVWGPHRTAQGSVSSSPILADGKLYVLNEHAVTTVLAAGPEYYLLASNELDGEYTLSSPAIAGDEIFIRTATSLYCIGKPAD